MVPAAKIWMAAAAAAGHVVEEQAGQMFNLLSSSKGHSTDFYWNLPGNNKRCL